MSSWWVLPFSIMKCPSPSLFMAFVLKSVLSDMSFDTLGIVSYVNSWNVFFQPFTFGLCRSFVLRWVSFRQYICGTFSYSFSYAKSFRLELLIHLLLRLLLLGTYSLPCFPFVAVFLSLSHSFSSSSYYSPFNMSCSAGLVEVYSFSLPFSRKLLILPSILNGSLPIRVVLVTGLCFSFLGIFLAIPFWFVVFLLRNQLLALSELLFILLSLSPLLCLRFSLCL